MAMYSAKFQIHKGKRGAFQANPIPPTWEGTPAKDKEGNLIKDKDGKQIYNYKVTREGSILIEMAPFKEERDNNFYYDWANKASIAIGVADVCKIAENAGGKFSLIHDLNGEMKTMQFLPGEKEYEGTMQIFLSHTKNKEPVAKASIAMSNGEFTIFLTLLKDSVSKTLGWDEISGLA